MPCSSPLLRDFALRCCARPVQFGTFLGLDIASNPAHDKTACADHSCRFFALNRRLSAKLEKRNIDDQLNER